jgi:hypothetical protein
MIQKLEAGLGIPAEILIQPYELVDAQGETDRASSPTFEYRRERRLQQPSSQHVIAED